MVDCIINVFIDIADCFLNMGLDRLIDRFAKKKKKGSNLSSREKWKATEHQELGCWLAPFTRKVNSFFIH